MMAKRPDRMKAVSIIEAAERDMKFTMTLNPTKESGATIVRNIYESFRMLGEALLTARGVRSQDHRETINELFKIKADTPRPLHLIDSLRRLRHGINYYGYAPKMEEVADAISIAEGCFPPLLKEVRKKVNA
ncbi:MAG: hypothetical protein HY519_03340 [Candidatus Aenigmarchaeota archaeon]|nr:hypothetical protein [Candidatus Aenigmarchaeota archaeon]